MTFVGKKLSDILPVA